MHHLWKRSATKSIKFTQPLKAQFIRYNSRIRGVQYTDKKEICRQPFGTFNYIRTECSCGYTLAHTFTYTLPQRNNNNNNLPHRTHQSQLNLHSNRIYRNDRQREIQRDKKGNFFLNKKQKGEIIRNRINTNQSYHLVQL